MLGRSIKSNSCSCKRNFVMNEYGKYNYIVYESMLQMCGQYSTVTVTVVVKMTPTAVTTSAKSDEKQMKFCKVVLPTASHCIFVVIIGVHVLFQRVRKSKCLRGELHMRRNTSVNESMSSVEKWGGYFICVDVQHLQAKRIYLDKKFSTSCMRLCLLVYFK